MSMSFVAVSRVSIFFRCGSSRRCSRLQRASPWVDGASAAAQTMEWLANHGMTGLLHRTVLVLDDSDGHANQRTRTILAQ
jgi:hypothetical protein